MFLNLHEAGGQNKFYYLTEQMKNRYFFTSRYTNDIYQFIVDACAKDLKISKSNGYKNLEIKELKLLRKLNFKFLFFILIQFLKGKFFSKRKITKLKYKYINVGQYLTAMTARNYATYQSSFSYYVELFKNIIRICYRIETANYYLKNYKFSGVYVDHAMYLNGVLFDIFFANKKIIYSNQHPQSLFKIIPQKNKDANFLNYLKIKYDNKNLSQTEKIGTKRLIKKLFFNPKKYIAYMQDTPLKKFNKKFDKRLLKSFEYIVYSHAVTDAQLLCGIDGFASILDWQIFTIEQLIKENKKFIVKAHPSFHMKGKMFLWERKIFSSLMNRYKKHQDILFIEEPIENLEVVKNLNPKCIILTHHGTAELEGIYHNLKVISFKNNIYDHKYEISNKWSNIEEYKSLLKRNWSKLEYANYDNYLKLMNKYYVKGPYFGKHFYLNALQDHMIKNKVINKNFNNIENMIKIFNKSKNKKKIIKNLNIRIQEM